MKGIPSIVYRDISNAVETAIQCGVTPEQFKTIVADSWDDELRLQRERDRASFEEKG